MAEFACLPLFTDSWVADTAHLSRAERGLYHDLLVLCWRSPECRVPNDKAWIARRLACRDDELGMLDMIISEFMSTTGNWLFQKRLAKEFNFVRKNSEKQSARAKSRWDKENNEYHGNAARHASGNAPTPTPTPTPTASPKSPSFEDVDAALRRVPGVAEQPLAVDAVIAPIWQLVEQGYDLHRQILPSINRQLAKRGNRRVSRWSFFVPGIVEDSKSVAPAGATPANGFALSDDTWRKVLEAGRAKRAWQTERYGPKPSEPGCRVPPSLLQPGDGVGWTEWKATA